MISFTLIQRIGFLTFLPGLLRRFEIDVANTLAAAGLSSDALDNAEAVVPYAACGRLLAIATRRTNCPHFGLLLGERNGPASHGLLGELMHNAPTLGTALRDFNNHQHYTSGGGVSYTLLQESQAIFGYGILEKEIEGASQIYDAAAISAFNIISDLIGKNQPARITALISHAEPHDLTQYRRVFPGPIHFNADQTGVVFPRSWLDLPVRDADADLRKRLKIRIGDYRSSMSLDIATRLRRTMRVALLSDDLSSDEIAAELGVSKRGLHRRLAEIGTNYSQTLDDVRCELASQLLAHTSMCMSNISLVLRFSDQSIFSRSFVRWTGSTPQRWRTSHAIVAAQ